MALVKLEIKSTLSTWELGGERMKGAWKGEEGMVECKTADVSTQRSLLLN